MERSPALKKLNIGHVDYYYEDSTKPVKGGLDVPFLMLTLIILCIGVIMVFSASYASAYYESGKPEYYFIRQGLFAVVGVGAMLLVSHFNYKIYYKYAFWLLGISIFLLILVPVIGVESHGSKRWISLGFTTLQPSEIAKLAVVLTFAVLICNIRDKMSTFRYGVLPFAVILVILAGLLYLEPHLSATVIILALGAAMMFLGGVKYRWFFLGIALVAVVGYFVIGQLGYASARINIWRDPFSDTQGDGWLMVQSLLSIGSGGLTGLGLGNSRQKFLYLPEEHNDFIFSVVCEELGLVGAIVIIVLFMLLILRGYWLALHARDKFGMLVIAGIMTLLSLQVFFNIAVVTNLLPTTGISLPFFSYGGSALVMQLVEMGIVLGVARYNTPSDKK